jgi:hypothetical protein
VKIEDFAKKGGKLALEKNKKSGFSKPLFISI